MLPLQEVIMGLPWRSSDWDTAHPMQGPWVQSLVRELRSHMPCGEANKKKVVRESLALKISRNDALDSVCSSLQFACKPTNNQSESYAQDQKYKEQSFLTPFLVFIDSINCISQALSSYSPRGEWNLPSRSIQNHWAEEGPVAFRGLAST